MNATQIFIQAVMQNAGITQTEAEKVLAVYKKLKVIKFSKYDNQPHVVHGALYEKGVILKALREF